MVSRTISGAHYKWYHESVNWWKYIVQTEKLEKKNEMKTKRLHINTITAKTCTQHRDTKTWNDMEQKQQLEH